MKAIAALFAVLLALFLAAGCSPMSGPDLFATGRDARVYNAATGRYEWPDQSQKPRRRDKAAAVTASVRENALPTPAPASDGRVYNLQKGKYEWSDSGMPGSAPASR